MRKISPLFRISIGILISSRAYCNDLDFLTEHDNNEIKLNKQTQQKEKNSSSPLTSADEFSKLSLSDKQKFFNENLKVFEEATKYSDNKNEVIRQLREIGDNLKDIYTESRFSPIRKTIEAGLKDVFQIVSSQTPLTPKVQETEIIFKGDKEEKRVTLDTASEKLAKEIEKQDFTQMAPGTPSNFKNRALALMNQNFLNASNGLAQVPEVSGETKIANKNTRAKELDEIVRRQTQSGEPSITRFQREAALADFSDEAMRGLGLMNKQNVIDLTKAAVALALPPGVREFAQSQFQTLAKAQASGTNSKNVDTKVDSLVSLANNIRFQEYASKILSEQDLNRFNYNTAAAEILNDMKQVAKDLPEKIKAYIKEKLETGDSKTTDKAPSLAKAEELKNPSQKDSPLLSIPGPGGKSIPLVSLPPEYSSADQALNLPKEFATGSAISPSAISWIELARFLTSPEGLKVASAQGYDASILSSGRRSLELMLSELRAQNSLDLVGILKTPFPITPERLIIKADEVALQELRSFVALKPDTKAPVKSSKIKLSIDSPYSLGFVQKEASSVLDTFTKLTFGKSISKDELVLTKIQLLNSLTSKENVKEVWSFYDQRSFQLLKRAQANFHLVHYMLPLHKADNALSYLYKYTQKEIGVRIQLAKERQLKEGIRSRAPAETKK